LAVFVGAIFAEFFVRGALIVSGDAAATAKNIIASESLWRAGFAIDLIVDACYVAVTLILYVVLRPVNRNISLLAAFFSLVGCVVGIVAALAHLAPALILGGADYLKVFAPHQLQALAALSLKLHLYTSDVSLVFFGFYCVTIGYLIFKASYFPSFIGVLLILGGLAYLVNSFGFFLAPTLASRLIVVLVLPFIGELSLMLYLIVVGVNVTKWQEEASRAAS